MVINVRAAYEIDAGDSGGVQIWRYVCQRAHFALDMIGAAEALGCRGGGSNACRSSGAGASGGGWRQRCQVGAVRPKRIERRKSRKKGREQKRRGRGGDHFDAGLCVSGGRLNAL